LGACVSVCVVLWFYSICTDAEWNWWEPEVKNSSDWQPVAAWHAYNGGRRLWWVPCSVMRTNTLIGICLFHSTIYTLWACSIGWPWRRWVHHWLESVSLPD